MSWVHSLEWTKPGLAVLSLLFVSRFLVFVFCRFGDTSLQEKINGDNYSILNFYFEQLKEKFPDAGKPKILLANS